MKLHPKIFRAYDIRGEAFTDFDEDGFMVLGKAFVLYLEKKFQKSTPKIFVSGDARLSMKTLAPALITGLQKSKAKVVWGGSIPTPINYFAFHEGNFDAAIQISASHNPASDNGLKMTDKNGAISGDEIQKIYHLTQKIKLDETPEIKIGETPEINFSDIYQSKIKSITPEQKPLKIIVDAGNAIPGSFYPDILRKFKHEVFEIFCDLDTRFPNHQPDPERLENLHFLQQEVKDSQADIGFAYDGDGDRMGVILSDGTILNADKILYILSADFLERNPGETIILDAMTSQTLIQKLTALGAKVVLSKTGHSHIEHAMVEHQSMLGGEQSGHFMFGENFYGHDDALLASLRFIAAIEKNPKLIQEVTQNWGEMLEFSEKFTVPDEEKFHIMEKIVQTIDSKFVDTSTLDGIRINFGNQEWAIIRASNTSPKIAVRIEARTPESLSEKKDQLLALSGLLEI